MSLCSDRCPSQVFFFNQFCWETQLCHTPADVQPLPLQRSRAVNRRWEKPTSLHPRALDSSLSNSGKAAARKMTGGRGAKENWPCGLILTYCRNKSASRRLRALRTLQLGESATEHSGGELAAGKEAGCPLPSRSDSEASEWQPRSGGIAQSSRALPSFVFSSRQSRASNPPPSLGFAVLLPLPSPPHLLFPARRARGSRRRSIWQPPSARGGLQRVNGKRVPAPPVTLCSGRGRRAVRMSRQNPGGARGAGANPALPIRQSDPG